MIVDAHVHIQDCDHKQLGTLSKYFDKILFITCATSVDNYNKIKILDKKIKYLGFAGIHPWFVNNVDDIAQLEELLVCSSCGVGEIGLDKTAKKVDFQLQKDFFVKQLDLAYKYDRSVVIHCVRAWGTLLDIVNDHPIANNRCMVHGFAASLDVLSKIIDSDMYVSLNIKLLQDQPEHFTNCLNMVNNDHLMLETDLPYRFETYDYYEKITNYYLRCSEILSIGTQRLELQILNNIKHFVGVESFV